MNPAIAESAQAPLTASSGSSSAGTTIAAPRRNIAVDAYRGLVMLLDDGRGDAVGGRVSRLSPQPVLAHPCLQSVACRVGGHVAA